MTVDVADADGQAVDAARAARRPRPRGIGQRSGGRLRGEVLVALDAASSASTAIPRGRSSAATEAEKARFCVVGQARAVGHHGVDADRRGALDQLAVAGVVELEQERLAASGGGANAASRRSPPRAANEAGATRTITGAERASAARTPPRSRAGRNT